MPRGDGTGPEGRGSMTGRGLGLCVGYETPGFTKGRPRGGAGFGRGKHSRRRLPGKRTPVRPTYLPPSYPAQRTPVQTEEDELTALDQEKEAIRKEIDQLKKDLEEIEKRTKELKE